MTTNFDLSAVQSALREFDFSGWLFYDFRGSDPLARNVLGLSERPAGTRRWFYYVGAEGEPRGLVHHIESGALDGLPGKKQVYLSWTSLREGLQEILKGGGRVAMQYSPENHLPTLSRVDAGTVELVRSFGAEVVSSGDLVQRFEAALGADQAAGHRRAAKFLGETVDVVFAEVARAIRDGNEITERSLQELALGRFEEAGLVTDHGPIVGVNENAAMPHFEVPETGSATVREGDLLLFDLWAKERGAGSIYADITWCGFVGKSPGEEMKTVFDVVRRAREAAFELCDESFRAGRELRGFEVDRACRQTIEAAGYGEYFTHRTGHSIHELTHGNGANLDDLETHDTRLLLPSTLFSIEPGIYLTGRFGIRTEIDVFHAGDRAEVTGRPRQEELIPILERY